MVFKTCHPVRSAVDSELRKGYGSFTENWESGEEGKVPLENEEVKQF
jgi:hypothetical protein